MVHLAKSGLVCAAARGPRLAMHLAIAGVVASQATFAIKPNNGYRGWTYIAIMRGSTRRNDMGFMLMRLQRKPRPGLTHGRIVSNMLRLVQRRFCALDRHTRVNFRDIDVYVCINVTRKILYKPYNFDVSSWFAGRKKKCVSDFVLRVAGTHSSATLFRDSSANRG